MELSATSRIPSLALSLAILLPSPFDLCLPLQNPIFFLLRSVSCFPTRFVSAMPAIRLLVQSPSALLISTSGEPGDFD